MTTQASTARSPASAERAAARRLQLLLITVIGAGFAGVTLAAARIPHTPRPPAWHLVVAIAAFLVADMPLLHIRFGHNQHSFTWSETFVVVGLVLLPSPWLQLLVPFTIAAAHLVGGRALAKVLFNAASFGVGVYLARAVVDAVGSVDRLSDILDGRAWLSLVAGSLTFWVWNSISVSAAVAFSQGIRVRTVARKGLGLNFVVWAGNTAAGIAMLVMGTLDVRLLLVLPLFIGLLFLAYRGYLRAMQERDTWEVLQAASRDLNSLDRDELAAVVLARAESLFKAEFAELMITDGEPGTRAVIYRRHGEGGSERFEADPMDVAATFWPRAFGEGEPFEILVRSAAASPRAELESLGLAATVVAPLATAQGCIGTFRIGFRGVVKLARRDSIMNARERQVFSTFAHQVTASVYNSCLFEEVSEERSKLSRIVGNTSDGIFSVTVGGAVTSWNPAMARMTARGAGDAVARPLSAVLVATAQDGSAVSFDWLRQRLGDGDHSSLVSIEAKGQKRWLQLSVAEVESIAGEAGGEESVVVVARDVTAEREVDEAKQDFVATVSHELRTPLTSLIGFLLTLRRPEFTPAPEDLADYHDRMLRQARRLERLIEDLLSVSRLERGEFTVETLPVSVDEVVEKILQDFAVANPARPLGHQRAGLVGMAMADPGRLEQVLSNLVSNADKYSPPQGSITISVTREDGEVVVGVRDEGPGIPDDQREAVFERFHRLGHHLTREQGGTGLGLYIAQRLVEAMGGRIWVESNPNGGSTFLFTIPAAPLVAADRSAVS